MFERIPLRHGQEGEAIEVGSGDRCVALQIIGPRYRGVVLTPDEARALAIQLIERAHTADRASAVDSDAS